jgi:flagellar hook-length control protein FliK
MNVNSLLASLLANPAQAAATANAAGAPAAPAPSESGAQFKAQFGQAIAALTGIVANAKDSSASSASAAQTATEALATALQKKISDLLAAGHSVQDIIQQLAAALANAFAGQFGGNAAQVQSQLQTAFATALSPPGNGPPASTADLASTLAQRFRQIADLAAGVIGEAGQSNRLFAGSFSDAATTAGGQPAPGPTNGTTTTDSIASDASALLANLTASRGDGKTVALTAPAIGTNGDTLLGRILARATQASPVVASTPAEAPTAASNAPATPPAAPAADLVDRALAAATALLGGTPISNPAPAPAAAAAGSTPASPSAAIAAALRADVLAFTSPSAAASAPAASDTAAAASTAPAAPALNPAVTAFVKSFTDAFAAAGGDATPVAPGKSTADAGTATVLPTIVDSSQAPTIGAFTPVAPALTVDALAANPTPSLSPSPATMTDPTTVIEQVLRGAFLTTAGATSTVRLRLVPETLGDVSVKLAIDGSSVSAQVVAQTPAAHDALMAGAGQLEKSLADAGLKLTSFNVSLGGGFTSFQQQQQQSGQQQTSSGRRLLLGDVDTPETDDTSLSAIPSFAPPTSAPATGWGAYNYLV